MTLKDKWRAYKERHGMREDVLPCPKCRSDRTWTTGSLHPLGLQVKCAGCGFKGPLAQTRDMAIMLWNGLSNSE